MHVETENDISLTRGNDYGAVSLISAIDRAGGETKMYKCATCGYGNAKNRY